MERNLPPQKNPSNPRDKQHYGSQERRPEINSPGQQRDKQQPFRQGQDPRRTQGNRPEEQPWKQKQPPHKQ